MGKVEINVDDFYGRTAFYQFIPPSVFDRLEAAYLAGDLNIEISMNEYISLRSSLKNVGLCQLPK